MKKIYAILSEEEFRTAVEQLYNNVREHVYEVAVERFFIDALERTAERANDLHGATNAQLFKYWKSYSTIDMLYSLNAKSKFETFKNDCHAKRQAAEATS